jgi:hypothetical protein
MDVPQNADRPLKTRASGIAFAPGDHAEIHTDARSGSPPIQNDPLEQPPTTALTAPDERFESLIGLDLINRVKRIDWHGDVASRGQFVIKNFPDKSAWAEIASDDAPHEKPSWRWLILGWWRSHAGDPFRKRNDDLSLTIAIVVAIVGDARAPHTQNHEQRCSRNEPQPLRHG